MGDCEELEQQLARLEASFNVLDALRPDLPLDELYLLALTGLCDLQSYAVGSLWVCRDGPNRAVATTGMDRTRAQRIAATSIANAAFSHMLTAAEQHAGVFCLSWPLTADVPPALHPAGADGHTLIVPLAGTVPLGFVALEAATAFPQADVLEQLGRFADRIAAKLDAAHFAHENTQTITELRHLYEEQRRLQEMILELSVPVLPLVAGVLVLPLVGAIDSMRAGHLLTAELESILAHQATVVLVDITGVPIIDSAVALQLIRAAEAARLLGCQTVLVGVRPETAQTLVGLRLELHGIATRATLADGLETALRLVRRHIVAVG